MKLELGSGYNPTPGFMHLDANPNAPDLHFVGLAYPLPDALLSREGRFDELRAVDVLEHISYRDVNSAIMGWSRMLKPGGRIYVQVPDADLIMREYVRRSDAGEKWTADGWANIDPIQGAEWRLLGGHRDGNYVADGDDWRWNAHYSLWTPDSLTWAFGRCHMEVESLEINPHPNICVVFRKL